MLDALPAISPISCFSLNFTIPLATNSFFDRKKYRERDFLPNTHIASNQEIFGEIIIGWNLQGIYLIVEVCQPFENSSTTEVSQGDKLEVFVDTRDQKNYNITRFCHHFIFLPAAIDNILSKEITEFTLENRRKLADSVDLINTVTFNKR